jgi:hypothetical protein
MVCSPDLSSKREWPHGRLFDQIPPAVAGIAFGSAHALFGAGNPAKPAPTRASRRP